MLWWWWWWARLLVGIRVATKFCMHPTPFFPPLPFGCEQEVVAAYGEDPKSAKTEEFCGIFSTFADSFARAIETNHKRKAIEEKRRKKEAAKAARAARMR